MSGPPDLGPVYRTAPDVSFHRGQIWAGTPPEFFDYLGRHFDFRTDDIWLVSFPRSGTTWTYELAHAILRGGDIEGLKRAQQAGKILRFVPLEIGIRSPAVLPERLAAWKSLPSPRVIPTHLPARLFPAEAVALRCKLVHVQRDPRDIAVSLYHFHRSHKLLGSYKGPWSEFFEAFVAGRVTYGHWCDHTLGWSAHVQAHPDTAIGLSYELLQGDFAGEAGRLAAHLGIALPAAAVAAIAAHTSFESMGANPFTNRAGNPMMDFSVAPFLRKGEIGDWRRHFTPEQVERFRAMWEERMRNSALYPSLSWAPATSD